MKNLIAKHLMDIWNSDSALFNLFAPLGMVIAFFIMAFPLFGFVIFSDPTSFGYLLLFYAGLCLIAAIRMIYLHFVKFKSV